MDPCTAELLRTEPHEGLEWELELSGEGRTYEEKQQTTTRSEQLQDLLAPAFYAGKPAIPPDLESSAAEYREVFARSVRPRMVRAYVEVSPAWCQWVGLTDG